MNEKTFEIREDEEQGIKLQQMLDLLLASGYFRARIKTLSSFDKIVGGIVWCISMCYYDIDVDLLFQEDSSIGSKIALTEKIVVALKQMKCPHLVEPHQIQGLDFKHIFPIVQWLVKKAMETQRGNEHKIREYSVAEFNKHHQLPETLSMEESTRKTVNTISYIEDVYKPRRRYKQIRVNLLAEEDERIKLALLEYGRKFTLSEDKKNEKQLKDGRHDVNNITNFPIEGLSETGLSGKNISMKSVANLFKLHSGELKETVTNLKTQIYDTFSEKNSELNTSSNLRKQIKIKKTNLEELQSLSRKLFDDEKIETEKLTRVEIEYNLLECELQDIKNQEGNQEENNKLNEMQILISENERLKREELIFKESCMKEKQQFTDQIEDLKNKIENSQLGKQEEDEGLQKKLISCVDNVKKIRSSMSKKNREIASMQRLIDDVPSRAELQQYQARFVELYNQVSLRHHQTKHFYNVFNTLEDSRLYLSKEINLLNSVGDTFQQAMTSSNQKAEFFRQFETIVNSVKSNKDTVEKRLLAEKLKLDSLNEKISQFNEQKRLYYKVVKDFQEECHKNELLNSKLHEL